MNNTLNVAICVPFLTAMTFGCSVRETDQSSSKTAAIVSDNEEIESLEQDLEASVEQPLSGASSDVREFEGTTVEDVANDAVKHAGSYFEPAGCVTSTREENVVTHVLDDCTGPRGRTLNGTVVSTWSLTEEGVQVLHDAEGLEINGAVVDHHSTIDYERLAGVDTRNRTSSTVGKTASGLPIDHGAEFTIVFDSGSPCYERNGSASTVIDGREWSRTVAGWNACGGRFTCPSSGVITMSGPRGEASIDITAAGVYDITVNGRTYVDREMLWCVAK